MNGDDILRALEARRDELDRAIAQMRGILLLLTGPAVPEDVVLKRHRGPDKTHKARNSVTVPMDVATNIVVYVASSAVPVAGSDILEAVRGARHEHLYLLKKQGRLVSTGKTTATRYSVPPKGKAKGAPSPDGVVVWDGSNGGSHSGYQQKAKG